MTTTVIDGVIAPHDEKTRRALLCFATDLAVDNYGQGSPYKLDMGGADLSLLNTGRAPLLDGHMRQLESVLGVVETAWIEGTQGWAIARFASHSRAADAWAMVRERIVTNVSMGFFHPDADPGTDGVRLIPSWRPYEVSLCAVPANWTAGVLPQPQAEALGALVDAIEDRKKREVAEAIQAVQRQERRRWAQDAAPSVAERLGTDPALTAEAMAEAVG
ncbi:HK97 family phage prohead protease [Muricoccus pecuniae]|uniref:Prohead serine protease n=1 Tax=Muricoccus pecuniae TaxID=693023 RepID=A0A840YKQ0_9PROT|nr:hypothetical protein [Roseomonas pecuniae]MBB5695522.1 hypothetical protein [Roseomonas pecuniae]